MVLEGVVVSVLNRFLGPYVKNLDSSQLKVGIWSGEVELAGLELKETALSQFDMPFRIIKGELGKLRMSIPWKSLYTDPVVIELEGLYIVAGPESAVKYDPGKEKKEEIEKKQRKLNEIEEARKKKDTTADSPASDPGFVEKLVTQIIRNVQLSVKNIHICYEDRVSANVPFTCGVTLDSLLLKSTNGQWKVIGPNNSASGESTANPIIYKLVELNCFSLYWNRNVTVTEGLKKDWKDNLKGQISRYNAVPPKSIDYIINPLSAVAKLQLTTRPQGDTPMLNADLTVHDITLSLGKGQYRNALCLVDAIDRMSTGRKYRKYRPNVALKSRPSAWWQYAYRSVLEEDVKRRLYMWSWKRMKKHRALCKEYVKLYTEKLVNKTPPPYILAKIEDIEDDLDVFNITVCRQLAENKASKKIQLKKEAQGKAGWFGGWFGGGASNTQSASQETLPTAEELAKEREKLYAAIGYSEKGKAASYPREYVAHKVNFLLKKVALRFSEGNQTVSELVTTAVTLQVNHRPASKNISIQSTVKRFDMFGTAQPGGHTPSLISTLTEQDGKPLLSLAVEVNPLGSHFNQRISVSLLPVQMVYDAPTINNLLDMFIPPTPVKLQSMGSGVSSTLASLRTQTRAGLEHAISERKMMDISVSLHSPILYLPEGGVMREGGSVLVVNLGSLTVKSDMRHNVPDVRGATYEELKDAFYDHLNMSVDNVNLSLKRGDNVSSLIDPISVTMAIHKSLLPNDTNLPGVKIDGDLPSVSLTLSTHSLEELIKLFQSLPLPPPALSNRTPTKQYSDLPTITDHPINTNSLLAVAQQLEEKKTPSPIHVSSDEDSDDFQTASEGEGEGSVGVANPILRPTSEEVQSSTKLQADISIGSLVFKFKVGEDDLLDLNLSTLKVGVAINTWDTSLSATIHSLTVLDYYRRSDPVQLLASDQSASFISADVVMANRDAPHYKSKYCTVEKKLTLSMATMNMTLRQETICYILQLIDEMQSLLKSDATPTIKEEAGSQVPAVKQDSAGDAKTTPTRPPISGEVLLSMSVVLGGVGVALNSDQLGGIAAANVGAMQLSLERTKERTFIKTNIGNFALIDPSNESDHPNIKVVYCEESQCIGAELTLYETTFNGIDMKVGVAIKQVEVLARIQILAKLLEFMRALKISQQSIERAKTTAKDTASAAVTKVKERDQSDKRIHITMSLDAPKISIPTSPYGTSGSTLVANLGSLNINNTFSTQDSISFETFVIKLSSIELYRSDNGVVADHFINPFQLQLDVKRNLSGVYTAHPMVGVVLTLPSLELLLSPRGTQMLQEVINYNLKLLPSLQEADDFKTSSEGKGEGTVGVANPILRPTSEEIQSITKLQADINMGSLVFKFKVGEDDLLDLNLSTLKVGVAINTWDTSLSATIHSLTVLDYYRRSDPVQLLASDQSASFISADVVMANRDAPHYKSKYCTVEKKLTLSMATMNMTLRQETICYILQLIDEMQSLLKSDATPTIKEEVGSQVPAVKQDSAGDAKTTPTRPPISGEVLLSMSVYLGGVDVALKSDQLGGIAAANVGAMQLSLERTKERTFIKTNIGNFALIDPSNESDHPNIKVVYCNESQCIGAELTLYETTFNGIDMKVGVAIKQVEVLARIQLFAKLLEFMRALKISQQSIERAKTTAKDTASAAVTKVKERDQSDKHIHITMSLDALHISIPTSPYGTSDSTLVANLGSLNINNTFSTQDSISFETFVIKLSSIELYRSDNGVVADHFINPFQLQLDVKRNLSGVYTAHPMVGVVLTLPSLELLLSPRGTQVLQEVINYNLKLLPSLQEADDFKTASEGKGEGSVGVANPILRPTSEEIQSITKLQADINMGSLVFKFKVGEDDLLDLNLSTLKVGVAINTWDTSLSATIHSLTVLDYYRRSDPVQLLASDQSSSFISADVVMANRDAPHYKSKYCTVEKKLTLSMATMNMTLRQETICYILQLIDEMQSLLKSDATPTIKEEAGSQVPAVKQDSAGDAKTTPTRPPISGEVLLSMSVDLGGVDVALKSDQLGGIAAANVGAMQLSLERTKERTFIKTNIGNFALIDPSNESDHPNIKVVYCEESQCIGAELTLYETTFDGIDMKVGVAIKQVEVLARIQIFAKLLEFMRALKISQQSIERAKTTAKDTASAAVTKVKERDQSDKRIHITMSLDALHISIPTSPYDTSGSTLVANLGSLNINNTFSTQDSISFETFVIKLSSIELYRSDNGVVADHFINPFQLQLDVKRNLSGVYTAHPMVGVVLTLPSLELLLSPRGTQMLQEVINYNLKLLPSLQEADDFKTASEGKGEGTVGVANPILRPTSEEIQSITKLQADINMGSLVFKFKVGEDDLLDLNLSTLKVGVAINTWDTSLSATIHSLTVLDYYRRNDPVQLLASDQSSSFISADVVMANRDAPHYKSKYCTVEKKLTLSMATMNMTLRQETICYILQLIDEMQSLLKSDATPTIKEDAGSQVPAVKQDSKGDTKTTPTRPPISGEVLLSMSVDLGGVDVALKSDQLGGIAAANVGAMQLSLERTKERTFIKTNIGNFALIDPSNESDHPNIKVVYCEESQCIGAELTLYETTFDGIYMKVGVAIKQVEVLARIQILAKLLEFMRALKISQQSIERAKTTAKDTASAAVTKIKERDQSDKRIHITMSLDAPKISIPTSPYGTSDSTLVANLGSLNINNTFSTQDSISFETFVIKLSSIELYRSDNGVVADHFINPFQLQLDVKRNLSGVYTAHPMVGVVLTLPSLELLLSPRGTQMLQEVINYNLKLLPSLQEADDFKTASEGKGEGTVGVANPILRPTSEEIQSITKLQADINMGSLVFKFKVEEDDLLDLNLSTLRVGVAINTWDTSLSATMHSLTVLDYYRRSDPVQLLASDQSASFISADVVMANRDAPHYKSKYCTVEKKLTLSMATMNMTLRQETMCYILQLIDEMQSLLKSDATPTIKEEAGSQVPAVKQDSAGDAKTTPTRPPISGEVLLSMSVVLGGVGVALNSDQLGGIAAANVGAMQLSLERTKERTFIKTNIGNFALIDPSNESDHPNIKVVYCDESQCIGAELTLYETTFNGIDMKVGVAIKQVEVLARIQLFAKLLEFMRALKISQQSIERAKTTAKDTASAAVTKVKERDQSDKRIHITMSLDAPKISIPTSPYGTPGGSTLVANLGSLNINNTFSTQDSISFETFVIKLSSIELYRSDNGVVADHFIKPFQLQLDVKRNLSGVYTAHSMVGVVLTLPSLELLLSQCGTQMLQEVINYNLKLLPSLQEDTSDSQQLDTQSNAPPTSATGEESSGNHDDTGNHDNSDEYKLITASVQLEGVGITVYRSTTGHEDSNVVTAIKTEGIGFNATISSKSAISFDLDVNCAIIRDIRPDALQGFQSVLTKRGASTDKLLEVKGHQDTTEQFVQLSVVKPELSLNVPFVLYLLLTLKEISAPFGSIDKPTPTTPIPDEQVTPVDQQVVPVDQHSRRVKLSVIKPRLQLLAIQGEDRADSLVVECGMECSVHSQTGQVNIFANINEARVNCYLSVGDSVSHPLLLPCDISATLSMPGGQKKNLSLSMGKVQLCVTPSIVRVLLKVLSELKPAETKEKVVLTAPPDLWKAEPVDYSKWYLQPLLETKSVISQLLEEGEEQEGVDLGQSDPRGEFLSVDIQQVSVLVYLENETNGKLSTAFSILVGSYGYHGLKIIMEEWSGQLKASASLSTVMSAYNSVSDNWEPVLEPLVVEKENVSYHPWTLQMDANRSESGGLTVDVASVNALQLTVTKSSIRMVLALAKSYQMTSESLTTIPESINDIRFRNTTISFNNQLGPSFGIKLTPREHIKCDTATVDLSPSTQVHLVRQDNSDQYVLGEIIPPNQQQKSVVNVAVLGYKSFDILIKSSCSKYYPLIPKKGQDVLGMVIDIDRASASDPTVVTFRSPLQIKNHLAVPLKVYWTPHRSKDAILHSSIKPQEGCFLPVNVAHSGHLHFQPVIKNAKVGSTQEVSWRIGTKGTSVECSPVFIRVIPEVETYIDRLPFSLADRPHHILHVYLTVIIHNRLPHQHLKVTSNDSVPPGGVVKLYECNPQKKYEAAIMVKDMGKEYHGKLKIGHENEETSMCVTSDNGKELEVAIHRSLKGAMHISLYSKCVIANKTGYDLEYSTKDFWGKRSIVYHPKTQAYVLFGGSEMFVRVVGDRESEWSNKFSLDALGNEGVVSCKLKDSSVELMMGSKVQLSNFSLSKIVSITPFYMLANNTRDTISVLEYGQPTSKAVRLPPNEIVSFWPVESKKLFMVDINNTDDTFGTFSSTFDYSSNGTYFLRLASKVSGLSVHVHITPSAGIVSFNSYYEGAIPVRLVNTTDYPVMYGQSKKEEDKGEVEVVHMLLPGEAQMYTWDKPNGVRQLKWGMAEEGGVEYTPLQLKDGHGSVSLRGVALKGGVSPKESVSPKKGVSPKEGKRRVTSSLKGSLKGVVTGSLIRRRNKEGGDKCYWVSLSDSFQRVVMFTTDNRTSQRANDTQVVKMIAEVSLSVKALGLSLVNDLKRTEVCYIGLTQSDTVWERQVKGKKKNRFTPVEVALSLLLENHYQQGTNGVVPIPELEGTKVDFTDQEHVLLLKEGAEPVPLKRSCLDGLRASVGYSNYSKSVSLKINKLQIDNHLPFALHPTIFYCYPPPPSLAAVVVPKPFIETSLIITTNEGAGNNEIQFCQVLIQEMGFILDLEFLLEVLSLIELKKPEVSDNELLAQDLDLIKSKIEKSDIEQITSKGEKLNFKFVHLSPIDVHVSFSLDLSEDKKEEMMFYADSNVLLKMFLDFFHALFGIIGQAKNAEIKLGYFELQERLLSRDAIVNKIVKHYKQQFMYQLYSVVFGLEVLGNPVGFLRGVTEGTIGLFYQPIQGAVMGPEEFFQGLALGTHQFIGGTFGGIAGVGAKVTGVFGDVVAKLTFDEEFMKHRKRQQTSFGQGVESFSKGVFHGITGVVAQPISGAQKEGFIGFLKGTGKGVIGLVLRPTGGIIDFASATLTAVQKKTQVGDFELVQMRPARYIAPDKVVYPYSALLSEGFAVFMSYEEGKLYRQETYIGYNELSTDPLRSLLVTNNRFMVVKQGGALVTKWDDEFIVKYKNMISEAQEDAKKRSVTVTINEEESWIGGFVGGGGSKKTTKMVPSITAGKTSKAVVLINTGLKLNKSEQLLMF